MQRHSRHKRLWTFGISAALCWSIGTTAWAAGPGSSRQGGSYSGKAKIKEPDPEVPPPPGPDEHPEPLYDYKHAVRSGTPAGGLAPEQRFRVAIARMLDNVVIEDTDFGTVTGGEVAESEVEKDGDTEKVVVAHNPERYAQTRRESMTPEFRALLINELTQSGYFEVVEREDILTILREINFSQGGYVDKGDNVAKGNLVGVDYLLNGEIGLSPEWRQVGLMSSPYSVGSTPGSDDNDMPGEGKYQLVLRMYSVETGKIAGSGIGRGPTHELAIEDCVRELARSLSRSGIESDLRVATVRDGVVYVDGGLNRGLQVGMRFRVMEEGEEIRNADGEVIGRDSREVGLVEVTDVEPKMAKARIVHSSEDISADALLTSE